ncbi:MAG: hypothetical protein ACFFDT_09450 [Candidatus Hodarchaeota archaeon]
MQFPTHIIIGVLIQYAISTLIPTPLWLSLILIVIFTFSSHFLLDALAKVTYHPPERIEDNFWLIWHIFVYAIGILLVLIFIWEYWIGILFANLPDLWDWFTLRKIATRKNQPNWGIRYYLHPVANKIRSYLFFWLPNLNYNRAGILPEFILIFGFLLFYRHILF